MKAPDHVPAFAAGAADHAPPGTPQRALILAGGGMRVAWQAGALRALAGAGLRFTHADGTSGGIMNLAMLLSGLDPVAMCDRWRTLDVKGFASFLPVEKWFHAGGPEALGDARGVREKVFPHLGIDVERIHAARGLEGTFNVCNFGTKTVEPIPHTAIDDDLLIAGMALPIFMPAVRKGDTVYTDAVWIRDANLLEAVRRGADELWLLWCIGNTAEYKAGPFNQYVHMIEMAANGSLAEDLERIDEINQRRARGEAVYGHTRPVRLHVIRPERPLPLDPEYFLGRIDGATLIDLGYADARRYLARQTPAGVPLNSTATQMTIPKLGFTFRETMSGSFALGPTDPQRGADAGKAAGTTLALHATIFIDDLDAFIAHPDHLGRIVGRVDFTPFGTDLPASRGVFNLFSPSDDPLMKVMVYEVAFAHGGEDFYLAGHKEVKDDRGFDLWRDTTTLFTTLHRGTGKTGPIVGSGVLSLGPLELAKMVTTMHATDATSAAEETAAFMKFGRFFLGELWDSYLTRLRR